ncbi:hypothetical protein [Scytonema hofmannii]|uniref:hypothetical protein n=1 Tax=Scytonema hofmannii TaxID=34078 RepID=UPI00037E61DF|nr:hypothetical protein [Scytonema hofmannii]
MNLKRKFVQRRNKRKVSVLWWFRQKCRFWQPIAAAAAAMFSLLVTLIKVWQYFHS